jgi:hypothetical protein
MVCCHTKQCIQWIWMVLPATYVTFGEIDTELRITLISLKI